jgi:methylation protein EvaC
MSFTIIENCRFCHSKLIDCIDLGESFSLAGGFMTDVSDFKTEKVYPLSLSFCNNCYLLHCKQQINSDILFKNNYFYYSSMIPMLVNHFNNYAENLAESVENTSKYQIIEIGCNDGVMLKPLIQKGFKVIGVDPSNTVKKCIDDGLTIYNSYFNVELAEYIVQKHGLSDLFLSSNSFAHIDNMHSIMNGIKKVLRPDGFAIIEVHYSKVIIDELQFDFIYHEHMSYYNITSFYKIANLFQMSLEKVEYTKIHGKSIRVYLKNSSQKELTNELNEIIKNESYLCRLETYTVFNQKLKEWKVSILNILKPFRKLKIYGYGSGGRTNIILQFLDLNLEEIIDDAPSKINSYIPVYHKKIKSSQIIIDFPPDLLIILAWPYATDILEKLKTIYKGKCLIPLPNIKLFDC